jgi:hypothetical protein
MSACGITVRTLPKNSFDNIYRHRPNCAELRNTQPNFTAPCNIYLNVNSFDINTID